MRKNTKETAPITCPHCGKDITESVNKAMASRAGRARHPNRDEEFFRQIAKIRWAKENTAEGAKTE